MKNIIVDNIENLGSRLDKYLIDYFKEGTTRSFIQNLISEGKILVNNKICKASYKVNYKDIISILDYEIKKLNIEAENIPIDIIYEDKDIVIVNKVQGMVVHPAPSVYKGTLVNALMYHCKDLSSINGVERPGIIHRIDKDTSGLLVVAKNDLAHNFLSEQFKIHSIRREYVTLVHGVMKTTKGKIVTNIGRNPKDRIKMAVTINGKNAITEYSCIKKYKKNSLVLCKLKTGRTHQIRVHMNYIGFPIVGDPIYGYKNDNLYKNGQLLHARVIGFVHPTSRKYIEFKAELPKYFKNIINNL